MFSFNEEYCWSTSTGKLEFGGLFHVEGCPVLGGEVELPPEMKDAITKYKLDPEKSNPVTV